MWRAVQSAVEKESSRLRAYPDAFHRTVMDVWKKYRPDSMAPVFERRLEEAKNAIECGGDNIAAESGRGVAKSRAQNRKRELEQARTPQARAREEQGPASLPEDDEASNASNA